MHPRTIKYLLPFLVALVLLPCHKDSLIAQNKGKWVEGVGQVFQTEDMTAIEARQRARTRARADAVEKALGVTISAEQFLQQFEISRQSGNIIETGDSFTKFIRESRFGRIIEQGTWQEKDTVLVYGGESILRKTVWNRFYVIKEENKPDPNFKLALTLAKRQYKEGEALSFQVSATQDCYLTVFNISVNDTVYLIFPNEIEKSNKLAANQLRAIPGSYYSFRASLPAGKKIAMESLVAIATKDSLVFQAQERIKPGSGYAEIWKTGLNDVWKWVAEIDPDRRVEVIESFKIIK